MNVGDRLGPLVKGPLTTRNLVEYAGASLDFNRIHYDEPFAKAGGHPTVLVHGMLSMAFLGQLAAKAGVVRELKARFKAPCYVGDTVTVTGTVEAVEGEISIALVARRADGTVILEGAARVTR